MFNWLKKLLHTPDAPEEHHITLPGIDVAFNHTLRIVFLIDQTGATDDFALHQLNLWVEKHGYFLHGVSVAPEKESKQ